MSNPIKKLAGCEGCRKRREKLAKILGNWNDRKRHEKAAKQAGQSDPSIATAGSGDHGIGGHNAVHDAGKPQWGRGGKRIS